MTLFEIANNLRDKLDQVEVDEETGELLNLDALETDEAIFQDKLEACGVYAKELKATADAYKAEMDSLKKRVEAMTKKYDAFCDYIRMNMLMAETNSFETAKVKLSFRKSEAIEVENVNALPDDFKTVNFTVSANKKDIKSAISKGEEVPGARLVTRMNLQIK